MNKNIERSDNSRNFEAILEERLKAAKAEQNPYLGKATDTRSRIQQLLDRNNK